MNYFKLIKSVFLILLVFSGCAQDHIFYTISRETKPLEARIKGGPANMVVFKRAINGNDQPILYVASGTKLHWYAKNAGDTGTAGWDRSDVGIAQPGGTIVSIAATQEYLYAVCKYESGGALKGYLRRIGKNPGDKWDNVPLSASLSGSAYNSISSVYAIPEKTLVFAASITGNKDDAGKDDSYAVSYFDESPGSNALELIPGMTGTGRLSGAAYDGANIFFCTLGSGIYHFNTSTGTALPVQYADSNDTEKYYAGMISLKDGRTPETLIAAGRNGTLRTIVDEAGTFKVKLLDSSLKIISRDTSTSRDVNIATSAFALWRDPFQPQTPVLFLAGVNDPANTSYGYTEYEIKSTDLTLDLTQELPLAPARMPGKSAPTSTPYTTDDNFISSLEKYPVNHLFQAPVEIDENMTLFASTQTNGLWSYRERKDGWQWNAEE